ncbi:MAG: hypothetical protein MHM6MM_003499 [Cercozoa sp. M6MM]
MRQAEETVRLLQRHILGLADFKGAHVSNKTLVAAATLVRATQLYDKILSNLSSFCDAEADEAVNAMPVLLDSLLKTVIKPLTLPEAVLMQTVLNAEPNPANDRDGVLSVIDSAVAEVDLVMLPWKFRPSVCKTCPKMKTEVPRQQGRKRKQFETEFNSPSLTAPLLLGCDQVTSAVGPLREALSLFFQLEGLDNDARCNGEAHPNPEEANGQVPRTRAQRYEFLARRALYWLWTKKMTLILISSLLFAIFFRIASLLNVNIQELLRSYS